MSDATERLHAALEGRYHLTDTRLSPHSPSIILVLDSFEELRQVLPEQGGMKWP